ncbi:hypothetical protein J4212_02310 [Candidatus Woesearchaeota archaeon]|nr:hypothetical protein [Candidatus Woesearchaeota archaeon]
MKRLLFSLMISLLPALLVVSLASCAKNPPSKEFFEGKYLERIAAMEQGNFEMFYGLSSKISANESKEALKSAPAGFDLLASLKSGAARARALLSKMNEPSIETNETNAKLIYSGTGYFESEGGNFTAVHTVSFVLEEGDWKIDDVVTRLTPLG